MFRIAPTVFLCAVVLLGGASLTATAIGCGGGGSTPAAPPTLTGVTPPQGPAAGGTTITLTGTGFSAGAAVTVGGSSATAVTVLTPTTITCTTPAGTPSSTVGVSVTTVGGSASLPGSFTYNPLPTITAVTPPATSLFGGTPITITGSGFTANAAGPNTVTIGGSAAANVVTVNDGMITCDTVAGPLGSNPVQVTNANGSATSPFSLFEPILVADGGGNPNPLSWDLWAFDPTSNVVHMVGPIGFGVTSMDFDPVSGTLYGFTAPGVPGAMRDLITINPVTGAGTLIGPTNDGGAINHIIYGCTYVGNTLYGLDGPMLNLVTVNTATALVTVLFPGLPLAPGGGFAADLTNTNVYFMTADAAPAVIYSLNVGTGVATPGALLNGFTFAPGNLLAACYHQGTLYALDAAVPGGGGSPRQIVSVNPATGFLTPVGPPLPSPYAAAIASRRR